MSNAKVWTALALAGLLGLCWTSRAIAQPATPPAGGNDNGNAQRGDRRRPTAEEMRQRMEEWRKRASDQLRQKLGASEDEWKLLQPRIEKVQNLQRQGRGGMRFGFGGFGGRTSRFGGRGGRGSRGGNNNSNNSTASTPRTPMNPDGTPREQTEIEKKTQALSEVLNNKDASPAQITEALTGLRAARAKNQKELTTARKELQDIVTPKQEAQLVLMGVLE